MFITDQIGHFYIILLHELLDVDQYAPVYMQKQLKKGDI